MTRELLCYIADMPCSTCYPLETKWTEIKSDRGETLKKKCLPSRRNNVAYAPAPDMTRVACRRWRVCDWSHVGLDVGFENGHVNINVLVVQKPLVPLIGRLVAWTRVDRQTDRQTDRPTDRANTVTLAAHACRGLITHSITPPLVSMHWLSAYLQRKILCTPAMTIIRPRKQYLLQ